MPCREIGASRARLALAGALSHRWQHSQAVCSSAIAQSFGRCLRRLMRCCTSKHIKLRSETLKAVRRVVDKDASMMGDKVRRQCGAQAEARVLPSREFLLGAQNVMRVVHTAVRDSAASVRGQALDIIHAYAERDPDMARAWFDALLWVVVNDDGTSVRKKVLTSLCGMLLNGGIIAFDAASTKDFDVAEKRESLLKHVRDWAAVLRFLLQCAHLCASGGAGQMLRLHADPRESDSVKKLVFKAIAGLWFDPRYTRSTSIPPSAGVAGGNARATRRSSTAPPTLGRNGEDESKGEAPIPAEQAVDPRAAQLVTLQAGCLQDKTQAAWLGALLDRVLGIHEETVSEADRSKAQKTCEVLVSQIVDYVLLLFEVRCRAARLRRNALTCRLGRGCVVSRVESRGPSRPP